MPHRQSIVVLAVALAIGTASLPAMPQSDRPARPGLRVTHHARGLNPGEVVRITVDADRPLVAAQGRVFGRTVPLWPTHDPRVWEGLVGISLDAKPGDYELTVQATGPGDTTATGVHTLSIEGKQFRTRRIQVAESFANPPADEAERIQRDARLLARTFAGFRPERLWDGPFTAPVPGDSTSSFGRLTILNGRPGSRHMGADFHAAEGTPVRAPNAGEVVVAENLYFAGNTVIVDHGYGLYSLFGHLSRIAVTPGTTLRRGDLIGEAGATGRVTGPHLHWAVRLGSVTIDPLSLMVAVDGGA